MVVIHATDYIKFCKWLKDHREGYSYPEDIDLIMEEYPSCELINGRDFGLGFRLNEADAIMFKLKWE